MRALAFVTLILVVLISPATAQEAYDPYADRIVSDDISALPQAVQDKRAQLIEATKSGDMEQLRAIMDAQETPPRVSFGDPEDPIEHLRSESADGEGLEMLAILRNLLEAPYAIIGATSDEPSYVWPYLAVMEIPELTPAQKVDAYRIMPADLVKDLPEMGAWYYWRVFIGKNGDWQAFVAGD
jgi:hypothetical protein